MVDPWPSVKKATTQSALNVSSFVDQDRITVCPLTDRRLGDPAIRGLSSKHTYKANHVPF